ncbi:hypothetical protein [Faecalimicrobium sp. JNUCC 81]
MKKLLVSTLCFLLLFTNISFANPVLVEKSVKDLDMVNNNMNVLFKTILSKENLSKDDIFKQVAFNDSILSENSNKIITAYSKENNLHIKRTYSSIMYISSLYQLGLSSLLVYLDDTSQLDYFLDASASAVSANTLLLQLKSDIKK